MIATGVAYAAVHDYALLLVVAFAGTINPSGGSVSIFVPLEHAVLAREVPNADRTKAFARYSLVGAMAGAAGALIAAAPDFLAPIGLDRFAGIKLMFVLYALIGLIGAFVYARIPRFPQTHEERTAAVLGPSRPIIYKLAALFSLDSFASGFTVNSLLALWLFERFQLSLSTASLFFFWSSVLTAFSFPVAAWLARHIGLIRTMVYTHVPASLCFILAAFAPTLPVGARAAADPRGAVANGCSGALVLRHGGGHAARARGGGELHDGAAQPRFGGKPGLGRRLVRRLESRLAAADLRHTQDRLRPTAAGPVPARQAAGRDLTRLTARPSLRLYSSPRSSRAPRPCGRLGGDNT